MGGGDQRLAVQQPAEGERIVEEVDGVHMHDVGVPEVAEDLRGDRIPGAEAVGDAHHLDAVDHLAGGKAFVGRGEEPIEGNDAHAKTALQELAGKLGDHILQPAAVGNVLAHDLHGERRGMDGGKVGRAHLWSSGMGGGTPRPIIGGVIAPFVPIKTPSALKPG